LVGGKYKKFSIFLKKYFFNNDELIL